MKIPSIGTDSSHEKRDRRRSVANIQNDEFALKMMDVCIN